MPQYRREIFCFLFRKWGKGRRKARGMPRRLGYFLHDMRIWKWRKHSNWPKLAYRYSEDYGCSLVGRKEKKKSLRLFISRAISFLISSSLCALFFRCSLVVYTVKGEPYNDVSQEILLIVWIQQRNYRNSILQYENTLFIQKKNNKNSFFLKKNL